MFLPLISLQIKQLLCRLAMFFLTLPKELKIVLVTVLAGAMVCRSLVGIEPSLTLRFKPAIESVDGNRRSYQISLVL
jgi:hypothetical protein